MYDKFVAYLNSGPCIGADQNGDQDAWDACKAVRYHSREGETIIKCLMSDEIVPFRLKSRCG